MQETARFSTRLGGTLVALAIALFAYGAGGAHAEEPVIVYQNLNEGDVLGTGPFVVQMCFAEPINILDLDKGGDFEFRLLTEENQGHGLRIVFQNDAYGFAVYPGDTPSAAIPVETAVGGAWTFEYRVVDGDDGTPLEGQIHFTIADDAQPIPRATPPVCVPEGGTATPTVQQPTEPGTPRETRTPTGGTGTAVPSGTGATDGASPGVSGSATTTATPTAVDEGDDDGTDVLPILLLGLGAVGVIGGAAAVVYLMRRRRAA